MEVLVPDIYIDGLVQDRRNSNALAMELRLSYTKPQAIYDYLNQRWLVYRHIYASLCLSELNQDGGNITGNDNKKHLFKWKYKKIVNFNAIMRASC